MHNTLLILAAGISSRMKKSTADHAVSPEDAAQANTRSKGLIGVGEGGRPLLDYLLYNAQKSGYRNIIVIINEKNELIKQFYGAKSRNNQFHGLNISYAIQYIPAGREKPLGTADAVLQAMEQFPWLQQEEFTVCNSDNLYSQKALRLLRETNHPNAFISYDRSGLEFSAERIAKFAVTRVDAANYLIDVVEKPALEEMERYTDENGVVRVSMNIFKFNGKMIYNYLRNCPLTPGRNEKELASALRNLIADHPASVLGIPLKEHVPDLTEKNDIKKMRRYLAEHYPKLDWGE
ncbi:MAG TPA: nucleotidyltransferase [Caldithrix sp.]|nr:nucleotidyltransferase [Caldithrix sp.]